MGFVFNNIFFIPAVICRLITNIQHNYHHQHQVVDLWTLSFPVYVRFDSSSVISDIRLILFLHVYSPLTALECGQAPFHVYYHVLGMTIKRGMNCINHLYTAFGTTHNYSVTSNIRALQFTV